ncbi:hypothetical protein MARI_04760 [Marinobacter sp. JH2]|nr:hypothetical protein MARI_04760 [Marinobacter sp. JH2]
MIEINHHITSGTRYSMNLAVRFRYVYKGQRISWTGLMWSVMPATTFYSLAIRLPAHPGGLYRPTALTAERDLNCAWR